MGMALPLRFSRWRTRCASPTRSLSCANALADELAERLGRTDVVRVQVTEKNRNQIPARLVKLARSTRQ